MKSIIMRWFVSLRAIFDGPYLGQITIFICGLLQAHGTDECLGSMRFIRLIRI